MTDKKLLIIDGHNFLFRAFSVPFEFHSKDGTPLHVATTYLSMIRKILNLDSFTDIVVVFDSDHKTTNHDISEDYKANRIYEYEEGKSPFDHLPIIKECLNFLKIKSYEIKGIEADDVIASIATRYIKENKNSKVLIASSDSDFYQLLSSKISIINQGQIFDKNKLLSKFNITPKQYVYFKSMTGDSADNIKGVPGVGKIRASKIINKEIKFDLSGYKELLNINKKLITLNTELSVCKNLNVLRLNNKIQNMKNNKIFSEMGY